MSMRFSILLGALCILCTAAAMLMHGRPPAPQKLSLPSPPAPQLREKPSIAQPSTENVDIQSPYGPNGPPNPGTWLKSNEWLKKTLQEDPRIAIEWASSKKGQEQVIANLALANAWGEVDPEAARKWAAGLEEPALRVAITQNICRQMGEKDPEKALLEAGKLGSGDDINRLKGMIVMQWAKSDPDKAVAYARGVADAKERSSLISMAAIEIASSNPVRAATLITQEQEDSRAFDETAAAIVQQWVERDPPGASRWVSAFEESPLKVTCVTNIVGTWAMKDSTAAAQWLDSLPSGQSRESGNVLLKTIKQHSL